MGIELPAIFSQSLVCFNGTRLNFSFPSDKGGKVLPIFLLLIVCCTVIAIIHIEKQNIHKTLEIQAKYAVGRSNSYKDPTDITDDSLSYGIIFDCGSSGTRVYIYYWPPHNGDSHQLLDIHQLIGPDSKPVSKKVTPGLSTYNTNATFSAEYLKPLLNFAAENIPEHKHKETPLYIMATAGMRVISPDAVKAILDDISADIPKWFDFHFDASHVEVISGKMEGMYAWISLNYMLGRISHNSGVNPSSNKTVTSRKPTVGVIDMGGGSLQIAFEVDKQADVKDKDLMVSFSLSSSPDDQFHTYNLYTTTFLGFGANSAIDRYRRHLVHSHRKYSDSLTVEDNCLALDNEESYQYKDKEYLLRGTGNVTACMSDIEPRLNKSTSCHNEPCSINGVHQPPIGSESQFYGISEYWYSTYDVLNLRGYYNKASVLRHAQSFCDTPWKNTMERYNKNLYPHADMDRMRTECFKVAWIMDALHKGFGFADEFSHFLPVSEINGQEVQWSLGALVYRTRYLPLKRNAYPNWSGKGLSAQTQIVLPYVMLLCFILVIGTILLYCRHLQKMKVVPSLKNAPSMSYFMTGPDQAEQGLLEEKHYYAT